MTALDSSCILLSDVMDLFEKGLDIKDNTADHACMSYYYDYLTYH